MFTENKKNQPLQVG